MEARRPVPELLADARPYLEPPAEPWEHDTNVPWAVRDGAPSCPPELWRELQERWPEIRDYLRAEFWTR